MDVNIYNAEYASAGAIRHRACGFTFVELMVTLAIAAIVSVLTIPSLAVLFQNNRLTTSVNTLAGALFLTRSEAIKHNRPAIICKGTPAEGCKGSRKWQEGWLIFVDSDGDKSWGDNEPLIRVQDALPATISLQWSAFPSSNYLVYYPNGTASSNGTFTFCDERGSEAAKAVIISRVGRVRFSRKSASGNALNCPS